MRVEAIDQEGKFFLLVDTYGWSNSDMDEGFNRSSTSFVNGAGDMYPRLSERALLVHAYLNKPDDTIQDVPVSGEVWRPDSDAEDYENVAYKFEVALPEDGWYTVHYYLLPVDTYDGFFYDTAKEKVVDAATGDEYNVEDLVAVKQIQSEVIQKLFTPKTERMLNDKIGDLADLGMKEGKCSKDYKELLYANQFVDTQLSGAHVKFNDQLMYQAAQILHDLNSSDPYEFC